MCLTLVSLCLTTLAMLPLSVMCIKAEILRGATHESMLSEPSSLFIDRKALLNEQYGQILLLRFVVSNILYCVCDTVRSSL
jgi:hypothetical protein